jgi:oleate hydratase
MTEASSLGSMTTAPKLLSKRDGGAWQLWEKLAAGRPEFGNPQAFDGNIAESFWESFTVTLRDTAFFDQMKASSGNEAGTGGLVTFKDSSWFMSIVLAHQPHFLDQPKEIQVFWGYALFPDRVGNFVGKSMVDCTGEEILRELCGHLRFGTETVASANCIPCLMPFITSQFMPRLRSDRPLPVPPGSKNLAFIGQFVEIPDDVVFTVEYSVRSAQMAAYQLLGIDRAVPAVSRHHKTGKVKLQSVVTALR